MGSHNGRGLCEAISCLHIVYRQSNMQIANVCSAIFHDIICKPTQLRKKIKSTKTRRSVVICDDNDDLKPVCQ